MTRGTYKRPGERYFFLNGHLHAILHETKHTDEVLCYDYDDQQRKLYYGVDLEQKRERAYSLTEVCKLLRHGRVQIWRAAKLGFIPKGHQAKLPNSTRPSWPVFWRADELMLAWEHFASVHIGRPNKNGEIKNFMPTRAEFRRELEGTRQLYVLDDDGNLIPVWRT